MSNSGFIIYNRTYFIDTCNMLRDSVCEDLCRHNFELLSVDCIDSPCESVLFWLCLMIYCPNEVK